MVPLEADRVTACTFPLPLWSWPGRRGARPLGQGVSYGTRDADGSFIIQNQHAHAWAEVWFDGYGWVPFEPTPGASLPTVRRGSDNPLEPGAPGGHTTPEDPLQHDPGIEPPPGPNEPGQEEPAGISPLAIALVAAALLGLAAIILLGSRKVGVIKLYARLQARLRLFGWQRKEWETARETDRFRNCLIARPLPFCPPSKSLRGSQAEKRETDAMGRHIRFKSRLASRRQALTELD